MGKDPILSERIAVAIIERQRRLGPYTCAEELANVVKTVKGGFGIMHPARLTIQAIRIFLNQEMDQLRSALDGAFKILATGGHCSVITFKCLEVDVVMKFLRQREDPPLDVARTVPRTQLCELYPLVSTDLDYAVRRTARTSRPRMAELSHNPRSKSSGLFSLVKVPRISQYVHASPRKVAERFVRPQPLIFQGASEQVDRV